MAMKTVVRLGGRLGRIFGVVVAAFALVVGTSLVAQAQLPGLTYRTDSTLVDSEPYKSVRVSCPSGTQVVGGFFELKGADGAVVLDDFIPSATTLLVGAGEIVEPGTFKGGTTASWQIVATVACASALANYEVVPGTSAVGTGNTRNATARCPSEKQLVGGGASLSNGWGHVSINQLQHASGTTGSVNVNAVSGTNGYAEPWSVSAYAICASVTSTVIFNTDTSPSAGRIKSDPSQCPFGGTDWSLTTVGWNINPGFSNNTSRYITRTTVETNATQPFGTARAIATKTNDTPWLLLANIVCVTT